MDRWEKLKANMRASWRMAVNWVLGGATAAFGLYLAMPPDMQAAVIQMLPVEPRYVPFLVVVLAYIARVWPQPKLTAETKP